MTPLHFGRDIRCPTCHGSGEVLGGKLKCGVCYGTGIKSQPDPDRPDFDGETYDPKRDRARLKGSLLKVREAMSDGEWWTISRLADMAGCSHAAASARIRDLRKPKFGGHTVERRYVSDGLWEYRLRQADSKGETD